MQPKYILSPELSEYFASEEFSEEYAKAIEEEMSQWPVIWDGVAATELARQIEILEKQNAT
jgi:hypothetical protein